LGGWFVTTNAIKLYGSCGDARLQVGNILHSRCCGFELAVTVTFALAGAPPRASGHTSC
jgi:hypothetical protein